MERPDIRLAQVTLDCAPHQAREMIRFYTALLGYTLDGPEDGPFPYLYGGEGSTSITLQPEEGYQPPDWPTGAKGGQQVHIDFLVKDLDAAVAYALSVGAADSPVQFSRNWHILLDPAGHPFCLCRDNG